MTVRTRIAPSPTGDPHVGTAYVAIFNLAFARQQGGQFILRIEDTDRTRSEPRYEEAIFRSLRWLGLDWDEGPDKGGPYGPYRQSERSEIYRQHAEILLQRGTAYYCFCSKERLDQVRKAQEAAKAGVIMYDRHCRDLAPEEVKRNLQAGLPAVIRQKIPLSGETTFDDLVRGPITISNTIPDDQVLLKADGFPTYHLASIVDDHLMQITHVMRAEEWINSTPKHVLLYEAFGWEAPRFAHLPLLRNKDKSKISKRKNPVSLEWYQAEGYLPEAMINFLGLMGYAVSEDREIFGFADVQESFRFDRINPAGPIFDLEKLAWLNGVYLRNLGPDEARRRLANFGVLPERIDATGDMFPAVVERMRRLKDFEEVADYFFADHLTLDTALLVPKKRTPAETAPVLRRFADFVEAAPEWSKEAVEAGMRTLGDELGWAAKESFMAVRVAVTGKTTTPPLVESMLVLGRAKCATRLRDGAEALDS